MTRYYDHNKIKDATGVIFLVRDKRNGKYYLGAASTDSFLHNSAPKYIASGNITDNYYSPYFRLKRYCKLTVEERREYLRLRVIKYLYNNDNHVAFVMELRKKHGTDFNPRYYNTWEQKQQEVLENNRRRLIGWRIVDTSTGFESIIHDLPAYCKALGWDHKHLIRRANDGYRFRGRYKITKLHRGD